MVEVAALKTTTRVPKELWNRLKKRAIDDGVSLEAAVARALTAYLKETA